MAPDGHSAGPRTPVAPRLESLMLTRCLSCLLILASLAAAQGSTWVVSNQSCSGVDFHVLQDAIDFAADGDTIVVRQDFGAMHTDVTISAKSLTLVGLDDPGLGTVLNVASEVRDLGPDQRVVLQGLHFVSGLEVRDCAGSVWLQDCTFEASGTAQERSALDVIGCSGTVTAVGCTAEGADGLSTSDASAAARVVDGSLFLYDAVLQGGEGWSTAGTPSHGAPGAIVGEDGFILLSGCSVRGGDAGLDTSAPCAPAQGGTALVMDHVQTAAWTFGSAFAPGVGVSNGACPSGATGLAVGGVGAFHLQDLGGPARGFDTQASAFEGESITLEFTPAPGDQTFLLLSFDAAPVQLPGFAGALLPSAGVGSALFALGALGVPTSLPVGLPTDLIGLGQSVDLFLQALYLDAGEKVAGPGAVVTIHDESLQGQLDCGPIWVDDDAPGDPGPGDESLSDPLENGSSEHPFDSIQEALDAGNALDTIRVRDGTYGSASATTLSFGGKQLVLESENGPDACTILADQTAFAFGSEPQGAELRGFTIEGAGTVAVRVNVASEIIISDCVIQDGGGTGIIVHSFGQPLIRDTVIRGMGAGGIETLNAALPVIERCTLVANTSSVVGAGLFVRAGSQATIHDTIVTGNSAIIGSGVFVEGVADISGCTIAHNPAGPGSELHVTFGGLARVDNSILWGGTSPIHIQGTGALEIDWSNVKGGQAALSVGGSGGSVTWGANTLDVLPHFKDADADDLHLKAGSPCRDAGDPGFDDSGRADIDGQGRVQGGRVDMGADELP